MKYKITTNNANVDFNIRKCFGRCRRMCANKLVAYYVIFLVCLILILQEIKRLKN